MSSMTVSGPLYYLAPDALRAAKEEAPSFRTLFPELGVLGDRVENMLGPHLSNIHFLEIISLDTAENWPPEGNNSTSPEGPDGDSC